MENGQSALQLSGGFGGVDSLPKKTRKKKKKKQKQLIVAANKENHSVLCDVVDISEASSKLDSDALALLEEAKGDINLARTSFLGYSLAYLEEAMPDLYESIKDGKTAASREVHHALLELTWDAVAAYIPVTTKSGKPEGNDILQRLTSIAKSSSAARNRDGDDDWKILDVGCGNGLLLPFLLQEEENSTSLNYHGCDLSPRMIELAQKDYSTNSNLIRGSTICFEEIAFETIVGESDDKKNYYDTIIFNGSLQFFSNIKETLKMAKSLLEKNNDDGCSKKIVISHVNGASFVRKERIENPAMVLSIMPTVHELKEISQKLEMELEFPFEKTKLDQFYLAVLSLSSS